MVVGRMWIILRVEPRGMTQLESAVDDSLVDRWPLWWWRASTVLADPRMPTVLCWQWCEWHIVKSTLKFGLSLDLHRAPSDAFQKVVANSLQQCQTLKLSNLLTALANLTTLLAASYWTLRRFLGVENGQKFFSAYLGQSARPPSTVIECVAEWRGQEILELFLNSFPTWKFQAFLRFLWSCSWFFGLKLLDQNFK